MAEGTIPTTRQGEEMLQAEIVRLNKIITALINRAERSTSIQSSDFGLFQTAIMLEDQVRLRTQELRAALRENEKINRALLHTKQLMETEIVERKRTEEALRKARDQLEIRVDERTAELAWTHEALGAEVAERHRSEEVLAQAQKMEAVGQLTGGVAHDFNNLLTVILGSLQVLDERLQGDPVSRQLGQAAARAASRGAQLIRQLLAFSRRQALRPEEVDLNQLIAGGVELLRRTLGAAIDIETIPASGLCRAVADPHQVETALLNLALNARDAMPQGGKLTIETTNVVLDAAYAAREAEVIPGHYVMLAVSDTGTGMPPEVVNRVFEPFFTTKEVGKGSGLGLSMVYGFVKQSRGHIKIYSEPGHGTVVKLYLPQALADTPPVTAEARTADPQGCETVLVVEDDHDVRALAVMLLTDLGYRVLEAADGATALSRLQDPSIDLLFSDLIMPGGLSGQALAREAQRRRPGLKVLFTSGYTETAVVHHGRLDPGLPLLSKPYDKNKLACKVRQVLDDKQD